MIFQVVAGLHGKLYLYVRSWARYLMDDDVRSAELSRPTMSCRILMAPDTKATMG